MADARTLFDDLGEVRGLIADIGLNPDRFNYEVNSSLMSDTSPCNQIKVKCDCRKFTGKEMQALVNGLDHLPFKTTWSEGYKEVTKNYVWTIEFTEIGENRRHEDPDIANPGQIKFILSSYAVMQRTDQRSK